MVGTMGVWCLGLERASHSWILRTTRKSGQTELSFREEAGCNRDDENSSFKLVQNKILDNDNDVSVKEKVA